MKERYSQWILNNRLIVIILSLLAVLIMASGMKNLYFTTDYRIFFSKENPQLKAFDALQDTYTKNDNILFVIAPKNKQVFSQQTLAAVEELTDAAWQIPYSNRVDSVTNYQHTRAEGDDLVVEDLVTDARQLTDEQLVAIKKIALNEPLLLDRLISPSAETTGVNVVLQLPGKAQHLEVPEASQFATEIIERMQQAYPDLDFYTTGMVTMNNAFSQASQNDIKGLVPLMFLAVIIMLAILLRSFFATLITVVVILFSIISAMGLTGWIGVGLSPPTTSAPTIIMTIAVANCVHILMTFLKELGGAGNREEAMHESLRVNFQPVFLTSLTTAMGFMSMNFSDAPPFRDLGNIVAMGVVVSFFLSVSLLPACMTLLPVRPGKQSHRGKWMIEFSEFVIAQRNRLIVFMLCLIVLLVAFIPNNELNDEYVKYFDTSIQFRSDTDFVTQNLTGIYLIEYSLPAGKSGAIAEPEYLQNLERLASWYRQQDKVLHVNVLTDTMKRLNKNMHADDEAWYRLPDDRNLAAQYLLLYELSLPYGLDLNNQINVDKSATRMIVSLESMSTNELLAIEQQAQDWMSANLPGSMQTEGASSSVMFAHIGERNIRSMLIGTTVALILISLVLIVALKSVKIGLISMIPNLVPAAMAFGLWGLLVGEVGLALSVVTGMTLGIVVDDTVHFLSKYLRARREKNMSSPDAVRYAFANVGMALWVTSVALVAGFLVLSFSAFKLNSGMGLLTAITITFALIADFLFLPPLLMKLEGKSHAQNATAAVKPDAG